MAFQRVLCFSPRKRNRSPPTPCTLSFFCTRISKVLCLSHVKTLIGALIFLTLCTPIYVFTCDKHKTLEIRVQKERVQGVGGERLRLRGEKQRTL